MLLQAEEKTNVAQQMYPRFIPQREKHGPVGMGRLG